MTDIKVTVSENTVGTVTFEKDDFIFTVSRQDNSGKDSVSSPMASEVINQVYKENVADDHRIGDEAFGGIVIGSCVGLGNKYLLILSKHDVGDSNTCIEWCGNLVSDGTIAHSVTDGLYNTHQILKNGGYSSESIFEWLNKHIQGLNGYTDWYIPALDEISVLYQNRVYAELSAYNLGHYWSSTETLPSKVFTRHLYLGDMGEHYKNTNLYARVVRRQLVS